jgi:hypothetical protein
VGAHEGVGVLRGGGQVVADHVLRDEAGRVPGVLIRERFRMVDR